MLSNALRKSSKFSTTGFWPSDTFSMICRREKIWSIQDRPGLKPACCWRNSWSTVFCIRFSNTLANTLPVTDKSVIPRQLLQSVRSPFFGNGMMTSLLQSTGTASCCHTKLHTLVSWGIVESAVFSNSAWILSTPADLPFFYWRTATLTAFSVISSRRTGSCRVYIPTDVDFWRWFWAVQYVLKVLLPSFQLFFVGFCESPIFQFDYYLIATLIWRRNLI